jgi:hypothetical protein
MEPEGSLPHSQVPATCLYPEPAQSSPYPHLTFNFPSTIVDIARVARIIGCVEGSKQEHELRDINANICLTTGTPSIKLPYLLQINKFRMVIKLFLFYVP